MRQVIVEVEANTPEAENRLTELLVNNLREMRDKVQILPQQAYAEMPLQAGLATVSVIWKGGQR